MNESLSQWPVSVFFCALMQSSGRCSAALGLKLDSKFACGDCDRIEPARAVSLQRNHHELLPEGFNRAGFAGDSRLRRSPRRGSPARAIYGWFHREQLGRQRRIREQRIRVNSDLHLPAIANKCVIFATARTSGDSGHGPYAADRNPTSPPCNRSKPVFRAQVPRDAVASANTSRSTVLVRVLPEVSWQDRDVAQSGSIEVPALGRISVANSGKMLRNMLGLFAVQ